MLTMSAMARYGNGSSHVQRIYDSLVCKYAVSKLDDDKNDAHDL